jgi:hypothetical protein
METEEKACWDAYELPQRNRLRLVRERLNKTKTEEAKKVDDDYELKKLKEQVYMCSYQPPTSIFLPFQPETFTNYQSHPHRVSPHTMVRFATSAATGTLLLCSTALRVTLQVF